MGVDDDEDEDDDDDVDVVVVVVVVVDVLLGCDAVWSCRQVPEFQRYTATRTLVPPLSPHGITVQNITLTAVRTSGLRRRRTGKNA
jgi:uncharacterized lipoprotein